MAWFDWLLIPDCPLCQRPARRGQRQGCFCADCAEQLHSLRYQPWQTPLTPESPPLYVWGSYTGLLRRSLQLLKYQNQPQMGLTLGSWLGEAWQGSRRDWQRIDKLGVVPIPLHAERLQKRGYNQAELLSRAFCHVTGMTHFPAMLARRRSTQAQYGLSTTARQENLKGAFQVMQPVAMPLLIIDDIYTTGATVAAAIQALSASGTSVVGIIVAARPRLVVQSREQPLSV
ncbi:MAG: ComF family protein [Cyanobacteriota bacterium]|nr:ComF family protein [Cyanobacteriota bacterium]